MKRGGAVEFVARMIEAGPTDDCVDWPGWIDRHGYGMRRGGRAHRWVYEQIVGLIPPGLELDHLCRRRSCVNPRHLEPVTSHENWLRGSSPHRLNMDKTHCKWGHEFTDENTRVNKRGSRCCRTCDRARDKVWRQKVAASKASLQTATEA